MCQPGLEPVLADEVRALPEVGAVNEVHGGVEFSGPIELMYHANLQLSTAHRVLLRVANFLAQSGPALFGHIRRIVWEHYLGFEPHYSLHVTSRASRLNHFEKMRSTISKGISAELEKLGLAPTLQPEAPLQFFVRLEDDRATVSVNTSGEHLHRRGYRTQVGTAPLRETLAAALLLSGPLFKSDVVIDPMCGSGTLLLEAVRLKRGLPAGANRSFAFQHLPFFNPSHWERLKREALDNTQGDDTVYLGSDSDANVLAAALENGAALGLPDAVTFRQVDAFSQEVLSALPPGACSDGRCLLVSNLPYGRRLASGRPGPLAAELLQHFQRLGFKGTAVLLCSLDEPLVERPGLTITGSWPVRNGGLAVRLVRAELNGAGSQPDNEPGGSPAA